MTRTVAIIKPHALPHRFEIEHRIQQAGFEIVKERRMEFDTETDADTLLELFGADAASFREGAVWVYVLERRRAVDVWATLMGHPDPHVARANAPHSLRALFAIDHVQNAVMGSPDTHTAELQIASIFASSPPFPTVDLPVVDGDGDSDHASRKPAFRARPVPPTNAAPNIVPRTTRAAALRAGVAVEKTQVGPRTPPSKEQLLKTFENVPGHKRSGTITVASTAAPSITPRMTRAASLRLGLEPATPSPRRRESGGLQTSTFEGVPGHKRRESILVASVKPPLVSPRSNRSAELRQRGEQGPPSSSMFRGATTPKLPGMPRTASTTSSPSTPLASSRSVRRPSSVLQAPDTPSKPTTRPPPRPSSVASLHASPSITPRTNRSAVLRAAKLEAETLAAAKKKNRASRIAPSSFKPIAV